MDDVEAVAARLGTAVLTIRRAGLEGKLTGVEAALDEPTLPFFIQGTSRPGEGGRGAAHVPRGRGRRGPAARVARRRRPGGVRVVDGAPAVRAIGIGDRELRP